MTKSPSPYTTMPGSSEIHCFACLPTPRLAILLPLSSTNRPSSTSTSLTFALAILLFRCQGKGCNRDRSRKHVTWDAIGIDESLAEETPLTDSDTHVISALPSRQYFRH